MNNTIIRSSMAALAAAALAACGGGGSSAPTPAAAKAGTGSPGSTTSGSPGNAVGAAANFSGGTTKMTLVIPLAPNGTSANHVASLQNIGANTRLAAIKAKQAGRKPQFIDFNVTAGLQVSITAGSATTVYNYALNLGGPNCTNNYPYEYCELEFPTLGPAESITVTTLDQTPVGGTAPDPNTGISAGSTFPAGTAILSIGSTTQTLTLGGVTILSIPVYPVIGQWEDAGTNWGPNEPAVGDDYDSVSKTTRLVVQGNAPTAAVLYVIPTDWDLEAFFVSPVTPAGLTAAGQPFVDINGAPVAPSAVSSLSAVTLQALPGGPAYMSSAPATGTYSSTAAFPDTSFIYTGCCSATLQTALKYDGTLSPSGSYAGTITVSNNLSQPNPFYGASAPASPYGNPAPGPNYGNTALINPALVYSIAPVFAVASGSSAAVMSPSALTITGYDPGAANGFSPTVFCVDSNNTVYGSVSSNGPIANGVQTFTLATGVTAGTCAFQLTDHDTGVPEQPNHGYYP